VKNGRPARTLTVKGDSGSPDAITCHTAASCWAVGYGGAIHVVNARIAKVFNYGYDPIGLYDIACSSATTCTATGGYQTPSGSGLIISLADGKKQHTTTLSSSSMGVSGIACPTRTACIIAGFGAKFYNGMTALLRNGKVTRNHQVSDALLRSVACQTARTCTAVGYKTRPGAEAPLGGAIVPVRNDVPGKVTAAKGTSELYGVACPTASLCIAVGFRGKVKTAEAVIYTFK
jgi:hypothetical protein